MKKGLSCIVLFYILTLLVGCSDQEKKIDGAKWDCSVICAKTSDDENYVITYNDTKVIVKTEELFFQNRNDFKITVYLLNNGEEEYTTEIEAGGISTYMQISKDTTYTIGIHANVAENTLIKLIVYDGENSELYK